MIFKNISFIFQHCRCTDNCSSEDSCNCSDLSVKSWYDLEGKLKEDFDYKEPPMIFECNDMCRYDQDFRFKWYQNQIILNSIKLFLVTHELPIDLLGAMSTLVTIVYYNMESLFDCKHSECMEWVGESVQYRTFQKELLFANMLGKSYLIRKLKRGKIRIYLI